MRDLKTHFFTPEGVAKAVDGVSFSLRRGETLGLVGESGCGKTVTALSLLRLIPSPPGKIVGGQVLLEGRDLVSMEESELRRIRGDQVSMIFQEPMTSLNPVFTIGNQIAEVLTLHRNMSRRVAAARVVELLGLVGIPSPESRAREYPHQLSGGMRQRVMIAMALACNPRVLIADEPTTALDVTIQAQILDLMARLQEEFDTAILLITHDLGMVAESVRRVVVMYAGKVVEEGAVEDIFEAPKHPYTQGLLRSIPRVTRDLGKRRERLREIPGTVPSLLRMPQGCAFHPRCPVAVPLCFREEPRLELKEGREHHWARCWVAR